MILTGDGTPGRHPERPKASVALITAVSVAGASLYATVHPDSVGLAWRYDRAAVLAGQWWRLFSAHLVHGGITHWLLNMAGFVLILAVFPECFTTRRMAWLMPLTAISVTAGLFFRHPEIEWYLGLSGMLHAWFAFGTTKTAIEGAKLHALASIAVWVKVGYEQLAGPTVAAVTMASGPVIVEAHLYGALAGAAAAVCTAFAQALMRSPKIGFPQPQEPTATRK
jgi:rhomboid family GlyGly-CTERM serine protease